MTRSPESIPSAMPATSRPATLVLATAMVVALVAALSVLAAARASGVNVAGTWDSVYHCKKGWCAGTDFPNKLTLIQKAGSSNVSGHDAGGAVLSGILSGRRLTLKGTLGSGYSSTSVLTIAATGLTWSGSTSDSNGTSGTDTATKEVVPAQLIITAGSPGIIYGQAVPVIKPSYAGLRKGDKAPATPPTCGVVGRRPGTVPPVGAYTTACAGAADPHYTISYKVGSLKVNPAPLVVTPVAARVAFGMPLPTLRWKAAFLNGDSASALNPQPTCATNARTSHGLVSSPAGPYRIRCSGAKARNYRISYQTARLTVALARLSIAYTGSPTLTHGKPATLSATMVSARKVAVAGRSLTISIGSGSSKQSCKTGKSTAKGAAHCSIARLKRPTTGHTVVTMTFAGDRPGVAYDYGPASSSHLVHVT